MESFYSNFKHDFSEYKGAFYDFDKLLNVSEQTSQSQERWSDVWPLSEPTRWI